jgi:hypothetical protein
VKRGGEIGDDRSVIVATSTAQHDGPFDPFVTLALLLFPDEEVGERDVFGLRRIHGIHTPRNSARRRGCSQKER